MCSSAAEADAEASDARLKQAVTEMSRVKAAADGARAAAEEQASRHAQEATRLHQGGYQQTTPDEAYPCQGPHPVPGS